MATVEEVINYARSLADQGVGTDADGAYGTQCVDLPNSISQIYFGKILWGNAIDLLDSAASLGYEVVYDAVGVNPRAGAIFVMDTTYLCGHPYGHTGLVIEDSDGYTIKTIEQNIDGNADSLYVGGPARYNERNFDGIVGWFYPPYTGLPQGDPVIAPQPETPEDEVVVNEETAKFTVMVAGLNVRTAPHLTAEIAEVYTPGQTFIYDQWMDADGYRWLSYIGATSGKRRYVACGNVENGERINAFGEFSEA